VTHEDQAKLDFKLLFEGTKDYFFGVRGDDEVILEWSKRVGATQVTKEDIIAAVDFESPAEVTCEMGYTHPYVKPLINETSI